MRVLGIDPGLIITGYAVVGYESQKIIMYDYGCIRLSSQQSIPLRLSRIFDLVREKTSHYSVNVLSLETPFLGKNVSSYVKLGYVRGVIYLLSHQLSIPLYEFSPPEVKRAITGCGNAEKIHVARALMRFIPGLTFETLDVTDAVALSLCGLWRGRIPVQLR